MKQFRVIATNAFMELIRQPTFLLLAVGASVFMMLLASVYYFGLGEDTKLVKDSVLAVVLFVGILSCVLGATSSLAEEIRRGTALAVLSKPIGRIRFLLGKLTGVVGALTFQTYFGLLAALLASRMGFDAYGSPDYLALGIYAGAIALAFVIGGFANFFLQRPFVPTTVVALFLATTLAFIQINLLNKDGAWQPFGTHVDWRLIAAVVLILFALWILAGIAIACTTQLDLVPTLAVCTVVFLLGLVSDYFFGRSAEQGSFLARCIYAVLPNWQVFWLADALEPGKTIPWGYVANALGYVATSLTMILGIAVLAFDRRELS